MPETVFKKDIIAKVAKLAKTPKVRVAKVLDALAEAVTQELESGNSVKMCGFFNFFVRYREAKNAVNPQTGKPTVIPAVRTVHVRMSKPLKRRVQL